MPSWDHEDLKGGGFKIDRDAPVPLRLRAQGRTTAMIETAREIVSRGHKVMIIGHNEAYARELISKVGSLAEHAGIDRLRNRLLGRSDVVPMIDHYALDRLLDRLALLEDENGKLKAKLTRIGAIVND